MNEDDKIKTIDRMERYGGGFVKVLPKAWRLADPVNSRVIEDGFPGYIEKYGPGGEFDR